MFSSKSKSQHPTILNIYFCTYVNSDFILWLIRTTHNLLSVSVTKLINVCDAINQYTWPGSRNVQVRTQTINWPGARVKIRQVHDPMLFCKCNVNVMLFNTCALFHKGQIQCIYIEHSWDKSQWCSEDVCPPRPSIFFSFLFSFFFSVFQGPFSSRAPGHCPPMPTTCYSTGQNLFLVLYQYQLPPPLHHCIMLSLIASCTAQIIWHMCIFFSIYKYKAILGTQNCNT